MVVAATRSPPPHIFIASSTTTHGEPYTHHRRLLQLLNECTCMSQLKQIHAHALRTTSTHHPSALFIYSRVLHFSAFSDLSYASRLFRQFEDPNSFMWNTLIRAFACSTGRKDEAFVVFGRMLVDGSVAPDKHTFPFVLKACAYLFALFEGEQVHAQILKHGFGSDVYVNNSLIHLYASCGCLESARYVFDGMSERSLVSWNVMIEALVQFGEFDNALKLCSEMQEWFKPDGYTMQSIISACAGLGALSLGIWAHAYVLRKYDADVVSDVLVNNSLLDMYFKHGSIEIAKQVFERMTNRDVTSWNTMILGYAMHGKVEAALECFAVMVNAEHVMPNSITFVGVLSACNHRGMVSEGRKYFKMMVGEYKIEPRLEHYGCLVDLLARAGLIDEALVLASNMPMKPDVVIWRSLLDACCKKNAGVELSEEVAMQVLKSDGGVCSGVYVLLSRVYASARKWNEAGLVRRLMTDNGVTKEPGCSSIEIDGVAHEFFAGDTTHPKTNEIYQFLNVIEEKLDSVGYVPDLSQAPMVDGLSGGKQHSLRLHSERLAIAFGLLRMKPGEPIRIFKNLRVCNDCHKVTKLISCIFDVEIVVRDRVRFHHFKDGSCSCMDYW